MAFDVDLLLTFCVSDCHEVSLIDVSEVFDRRSVSFHCSNPSSPDPLPWQQTRPELFISSVTGFMKNKCFRWNKKPSWPEWMTTKIFYANHMAYYTMMHYERLQCSSMKNASCTELYVTEHICRFSASFNLLLSWLHSLVFASNCWHKVAISSTSSATTFISSAWTSACLDARLVVQSHSLSFVSRSGCFLCYEKIVKPTTTTIKK